ncbi:t(6)A37 threonylcarbamoyladenosine biosynthesis protein [Marinibacterium anthonyi]|nr:t(6)A37 threonylcarbamoyladenosine biosynthesis protein [Marinibacterium anthonyi]
MLAFDTSGPHVAACLVSGGEVVDQTSESMSRGQAERLIPALEEMLARAGLALSDLDAIGVGTGPGNFTGIRISVSAARGLALGLGIPAVGVSTLEAVALDAPRPMVAAVSASRGGAYYQVFDTGGPQDPQMIHSDGDSTGWEQLAGRFAPDMPLMAFDLPLQRPAHSLVQGIARIAARRYADPATPRPAPLYIRPADAAPSRERPPVLLD